MIRVTIDLIPCGDKTRTRTLSVLDIGNLSDSKEYCDYAYCLTDDRNPPITGLYEQHFRDDGVHSLVEGILRTLPQSLEQKYPDGKCPMSEIPPSERNAFEKYLTGAQVPIVDGVAGFYYIDYVSFRHRCYKYDDDKREKAFDEFYDQNMLTRR